MIDLALVVCSLSFFLQAQTTPTAPKSSPQAPPKITRAGERLLLGQATRIKQPLGYSVAPESTRENFLQFFQENYVRLRAYPGKTINAELRVRAYERLQLQRQELRLRHIGPGWLQRPRVGNAVPEGPGTLGTTGPGGCAWSSLGPTNINGRVTGIGIDPTNSQRLFVTSVGGIWRSIDGGRRWQRLSEDFLATVFASVAVNPANAVEIFAGAGDPNYGALGAHTATGVWRSGANGDPGSERLKAYKVTEEGVENTFHDTLVTNLVKLVDVLPKLNITNDANLDRLAEQVRDSLLERLQDFLGSNY